MKITVLGAGLIGSAIAVDLAQDADLDVFSVDLSQERLDKVTAKAPVKLRDSCRPICARWTTIRRCWPTRIRWCWPCPASWALRR